MFFVFSFTTAWWWTTCPVNIQPTDLARSLKVYSWDSYLHRVEISRTGPIFQLTVIIYDSPRVKSFSFARPTDRTELSCIRMAETNWWITSLQGTFAQLNESSPLTKTVTIVAASVRRWAQMRQVQWNFTGYKTIGLRGEFSAAVYPGEE